MDTKNTTTEQAPAESSTDLSEKTLSEISAGAIDSYIIFEDNKGGYIKGETAD